MSRTDSEIRKLIQQHYKLKHQEELRRIRRNFHIKDLAIEFLEYYEEIKDRYKNEYDIRNGEVEETSDEWT
jgi:hypothetical protein